MTTTSPAAAERRRRALDRLAEAANSYGIAVDAMNDAAAKVLKINRTDMRLIALIRKHGQLSPTRLSQTSGLSPAATTTAVGRLIKSGYADQHPDPSDGRRSVITLTTTARSALSEIYGPVLAAGEVNMRNAGLSELAVIENFLRMAEGLQHNHALTMLTELDAASRSERGA